MFLVDNSLSYAASEDNTPVLTKCNRRLTFVAPGSLVECDFGLRPSTNEWSGPFIFPPGINGTWTLYRDGGMWPSPPVYPLEKGDDIRVVNEQDKIIYEGSAKNYRSKTPVPKLFLRSLKGGWFKLKWNVPPHATVPVENLPRRHPPLYSAGILTVLFPILVLFVIVCKFQPPGVAWSDAWMQMVRVFVVGGFLVALYMWWYLHLDPRVHTDVLNWTYQAGVRTTLMWQTIPFVGFLFSYRAGVAKLASATWARFEKLVFIIEDTLLRRDHEETMKQRRDRSEQKEREKRVNNLKEEENKLRERIKRAEASAERVPEPREVPEEITQNTGFWQSRRYRYNQEELSANIRATSARASAAAELYQQLAVVQQKRKEFELALEDCNSIDVDIELQLTKKRSRLAAAKAEEQRLLQATEERRKLNDSRQTSKLQRVRKRALELLGLLPDDEIKARFIRQMSNAAILHIVDTLKREFPEEMKDPEVMAYFKTAGIKL